MSRDTGLNEFNLKRNSKSIHKADKEFALPTFWSCVNDFAWTVACFVLYFIYFLIIYLILRKIYVTHSACDLHNCLFCSFIFFFWVLAFTQFNFLPRKSLQLQFVKYLKNFSSFHFTSVPIEISTTPIFFLHNFNFLQTFQQLYMHTYIYCWHSFLRSIVEEQAHTYLLSNWNI